MNADQTRERSVEIAVGAFMFMVLLALAMLTIILSRENIFTEGYPLEIYFENVQGLREGDTVLSRGVEVGRVQQLALEEGRVRVDVRLDQRLILHEDYTIEILPSSVLGGQILTIHPGSPDAPRAPEDEKLVGLKPVDLVKEASQTIQAVREALVEGGVLDDVKATMKQLSELTATLDAGEGTLGKLLTDDTLHKDMEVVAANLRDISQRLADGQGTAGKLLAEDDELYADMRDVTANLKVVSQRLVDGKGMLGKLLSEEDTLYDDLSESVAAIKELTESLSSGEGTLGKLAQDDELYQEAKLLLQEVRAAVDDIRETAPITTFTSVFFGAF